MGTLLGALALGGLDPALARAQEGDAESQARLHFRVGRAYYDSGRFVEAAHEFEEAYRLSDRPQLLYNIFLAYRDAAQLDQAIDALRRYLELVPDAENRDQLTARLRSMERIAAQGGSPQQQQQQPQQQQPRQPPPTEQAAQPAQPASSAATTTPPPAQGDGGGGGTWMPGWIIAGVGGAAVVAGIITGVVALDQQSQLEAEYNCTEGGACDPGFESARDSGAALAGATDGLLFGGLAIAATGVVLALVLADSGSRDSATAGVMCGPQGCAASVQGRF